MGNIFFTQNENKIITGLANFDINQDRINLLGICIPRESKGNGTIIINAIKEFGRLNNKKELKLTCYGDVKKFYEKLGFEVIEQILVYNSDDEESENSEDGINKIRYEMVYKISKNYGGKQLLKKKKKSLKKKKKSLKKKATRKKVK